MQKATHEQTKAHNTRLILSHIYHHDEISRAELARITGLTRPTVSTIVSELLDSDLILETGQGPSSGGKPPTLLSIKNDAYQLMCIDLGSQEFRGAIVNLDGGIVDRVAFSIEGHTGEAAFQFVYKLINILMDLSSKPLLGIGIATPGLVDPHQGIVLRSVNLGWIELPLKKLLETQYQKPVYIANDSHLAALAEYMFGKLQESNHLIVLKVGKGIGAGIILNGELYYGDSFGAGEIGHLVVVDKEKKKCSCGNRGCLETVASTFAILGRAQEIVEKKPVSLLTRTQVISWDTVRDAFDAGDEATREMVADVGRYLGRAVACLIAGYNINNIAIESRLSHFGSFFLNIVKKEVGYSVFPGLVEGLDIRFVDLAGDTVILGCSAMVLRNELGIV